MSMHILTSEPKPTRVRKLSDLIFQHHSPKKLDELVPQTYKSIFSDRIETLDRDKAQEYINDRIEEEESYRELLNNPANESFIYATIVGFNKMESATSYPGFTYYFKLTADQLNSCLFGVIKDNKSAKLDLGQDGLIRSLKEWNKVVDEVDVVDDNILGIIEPRIEVVISTVIIPYAMIPEVESRTS